MLFGHTGGAHLSAVQEKAELEARYTSHTHSVQKAAAAKLGAAPRPSNTLTRQKEKARAQGARDNVYQSTTAVQNKTGDRFQGPNPKDKTVRMARDSTFSKSYIPTIQNLRN